MTELKISLVIFIYYMFSYLELKNLSKTTESVILSSGSKF